jgi:hypothetical protein
MESVLFIQRCILYFDDFEAAEPKNVSDLMTITGNDFMNSKVSKPLLVAETNSLYEDENVEKSRSM